ncbi:hypothetical protein PBY51_019883 [Eleginops maclovinus]|uniref:Uncharacterized protein n=1 Tax=Eleginops maclovinus TaxID=56733 RepID=A0AAN7XRN6_ELEMC|nr:hypothetical protein PBY51_019883 [Eleginops maclovinus]
MLSAGLPENLGLWGGEVEGVGWLSVPWGEEGEKKGGGSSTRPTRPVQSCPVKRAQSWGSDVDYKGGASFKTADVRVCGGGRVTR